MTRAPIRLAAACLALAAPGAAAAACNVAPQAVGFGAYDTLVGSAVDGVGSVNISCDEMTAFTVSMSAGNGTVADRRMTGGGAELAYNLFKDPARAVVWGEGISGGVSTSGDNVDLTVYGRIPALQNVPASIYLDSITVTVAF